MQLLGLHITYGCEGVDGLGHRGPVEVRSRGEHSGRRGAHARRPARVERARALSATYCPYTSIGCMH